MQTELYNFKKQFDCLVLNKYLIYHYFETIFDEKNTYIKLYYSQIINCIGNKNTLTLLCRLFKHYISTLKHPIWLIYFQRFYILFYCIFVNYY